MRALIGRDLTDAGVAGLSADRKFATAHNAALQAANNGYSLRRVPHYKQGRTPPCVVGKREARIGQTRAEVCGLFRDLPAKTKHDRLHLLQRSDRDGSKGDSRPGVPILRRGRRLDCKESPFTQTIGHALGRRWSARAGYLSSFFSASFGNAFSIALRGSIWSRMAAS